MRAMRIVAPGQVEAVEVARPTPGVGQVRVRVEGCGVCASNLGPWGGLPWLQYPLEVGQGGHEAWGRVDAVGEGVIGIDEGARVAFLGDRAWSEYAVAKATEVVLLPPELDDRPFPGEAFACAVNVFRRSAVQAGQRVAVVGVGFIGAAFVRLAAEAGAEVIAISRRPESLELAASLGAAHTVRMDDHWRIIAAVKELTGGRGCERVIEAVGLQWPLDLATALCAERGALVIAGYHQDGPRQVNLQQWNWLGLDVINAHERDPAIYVEGMRQAIAAVVDGRLDPRRLVTHAFPLTELGQALDATRDKPQGFVKAVVLP